LSRIARRQITNRRLELLQFPSVGLSQFGLGEKFLPLSEKILDLRRTGARKAKKVTRQDLVNAPVTDVLHIVVDDDVIDFVHQHDHWGGGRSLVSALDTPGKVNTRLPKCLRRKGKISCQGGMRLEPDESDTEEPSA
jgi:hypothetical protein